MTTKTQLDLAKPILLYVDGGEESKAAEALLRNSNIPIHVIEGCLDAGWNYPLMQFYPWEFEGLTEIHNFLASSMVQNKTLHDHTRVIHGRSRLTDKYPDGCLVIPDPKLQ